MKPTLLMAAVNAANFFVDVFSFFKYQSNSISLEDFDYLYKYIHVRGYTRVCTYINIQLHICL